MSIFTKIISGEIPSYKVAENNSFIAFLDNEAEGIEIELMQIYTSEELEKYSSYKGI